jgi:hypothetical protein
MSTEKNQASPEMAKFNTALRGALSLSKSDLNRILAEEKAHPTMQQKRGRKPKSLASAPVSSGKG